MNICFLNNKVCLELYQTLSATFKTDSVHSSSFALAREVIPCDEDAVMNQESYTHPLSPCAFIHVGIFF